MTTAKKPKYSPFVHLRTHSSFSLSEGALKIEEIATLCKKLKMPAVAITDSGNLFGALEFAYTLSGQGIQPIIGCVVNIAATVHKNGEDTETDLGTLVLLVQNETGYRNLLKLVSDSYLKGTDCHHPVITPDALGSHSDGLIALTGGPDGVIGRAVLANQMKEAESLIASLKTLFKDRLYMELMRHELDEETQSEQVFIDLAYAHDIPLVATNNAYFSTREKFEAHDALICIAGGTYVAEENRRHYTPEHYFKSAKEMTELFSDIPEAIDNTLTIARRCAFMPEAREPMLPSFPTENGRSEEEELRNVALTGLMKRLESYVFPEGISQEEKDKIAIPYMERLDYELGVIINMKFPGYFLIVSDFIRWSKEQGIPVGPGRGSGAGSVIAWALQITDLDPLRFGLLFERFLNPERISMPDFDIDFCQERRDEVIEYVRQKYGGDKVAQIITFGKLQARAVLRDVGRVLQMPYGQVDKICKMIPFNPLAPVTLSQAIDMDPQLKQERDTDPEIAKLLDIGLKLEGLHRHASTHAAGVVIADRSLDELVPLYTDHRSEIPTTQFAMKQVEMSGLVKFDFLGLKTLTVIDRACKLICEQGIEIDIHHLPFDDPATFALLASGATTGVFQMESAGMRDALRKMKPDSIEDIIALISLYRPGPMENIPTYIARKHGRETPDYLHPKLEDTLKETFGVIIYQEQVMKIAQELAGYSLGAADLLRRAMGKKIKAEMDAQRDLFMEGAANNNVDKKQAKDIFDKVAKFAGYGFNKSHAAAYAVIGYQTAWLKANHPIEFITASMNIDIGDTDKLNIFREEAIRSRIRILPPDINISGAYFSVEKLPEKEQTLGRKRAIRYGLGALKSVGLASMRELERERTENGPYKSVFDMAGRLDSKTVNKRQLESLSKAGAFDSLNPNRRQLFEAANLLTRHCQSMTRERLSNQENLFGMAEDSPVSDPALPDVDPWSDEEKMAQEFDAVGFYLTAHPLDSYMSELHHIGISSIATLEENVPQTGGTIKLAGIVTKVTHRATAKRRFAYLQVSDPTGSCEISVFDEGLISDSRELIESQKPLLITTDARKDEGGIRLQASAMHPLEGFLESREYSVYITLEHGADLNEIHRLLDSEGKGRARIFFILTTTTNMRVEVTLNDHYALSRDIVENIGNVAGVSHITTR